jgi:hypothetical protein
METSERKKGIPEVKAAKSFREIVENFTDPREVFREAISNGLDWGASSVTVTVYEDKNRADRELVIKIRDNGLGLTKERFHAFWNLADSPQLQKDEFGGKASQRIGEKGHGTKTFWKCRLLEVQSVARETDGTEWHVAAEMKEPINTLMQEKVPTYEYDEETLKGDQPTFTEITIRGYHVRSVEDFRHESLKDYIQWFTKFGSVELELGNETHKGKTLHLQGLGRSTAEVIHFGHVFPQVSNNIKQLQQLYQDSWPRYYVNKWVAKSLPIEGYPSSCLDIVFYLEGDSVKREYKAYRDEIEFTKERSVVERTERDEKFDLDWRYDFAKNKRAAKYQPAQVPSVTFLEPRQEAEVLALFSVAAAVNPNLFEFRIVDYSTSRGIDALCVLESAHGGLQKGNLRYVEFKKALTHDFRDHTFARLAAIVCWECNLSNGAKVRDLAGEERTLHISKDQQGNTLYMLLAPPNLPTNNIKIYVLKDYLKEKLGISFTAQT